MMTKKECKAEIEKAIGLKLANRFFNYRVSSCREMANNVRYGLSGFVFLPLKNLSGLTPIELPIKKVG